MTRLRALVRRLRSTWGSYAPVERLDRFEREGYLSTAPVSPDGFRWPAGLAPEKDPS